MYGRTRWTSAGLRATGELDVVDHSVQRLAGKLARWRWPGSALGWVWLPPPGEWPNAAVKGAGGVGHARIRADQLMHPATLASSPQAATHARARRCKRLPVIGRGILFHRSVVGRLGRQRSSTCAVRGGPPLEEARPPPSAACDRTAQGNQRKQSCGKASRRLGL